MRNSTSFKKGHLSYTKSGKESSQYRHGQYGTSLYKAWERMKRRCLNPRDKSYSRYGGAGVVISEAWLDFQVFARDMGPSFKEGLTLDRTDNSKGYSKENCRWATKLEQARNKRKVLLYEYKGVRLTIPEWAEVMGLSVNTLFARLKRYGWPIEKALETPVDPWKSNSSTTF